MHYFFEEERERRESSGWGWGGAGLFLCAGQRDRTIRENNEWLWAQPIKLPFLGAAPGPSLFFSNYNNDDFLKKEPPRSLYPTLELMVTLALLVPKVFRERLFCDLNNHSTLGSTQAQTKPHRLISGVHPDLAGILPHCAANQHAGWGGRARDRAISSDGASSQ